MGTLRSISPVVVAFAALSLTGCAAESEVAKDDPAASVEEVRLGGLTRDLGTMAYGDTRATRYSNPPGLRSYRFRGEARDRVEVWVRSATGDAMVWLTDGSRNILATNDDADRTTLDAHVTATLPAAGEYTVFFRDYYRQSHTFAVILSGTPDDSCGGFTRNPRTCSPGFVCVGEGLARDLPGRCVRGCTAPNGTVYAPGQSYNDGCNACSCREGGSAICTRRACVVCTVNGRTYNPGQTFNDGCNDCTCQANGQPSCTKRACICNPQAEPNRRYLGTAQTCPVIRFACRDGERSFSNACGCGCELL